jgi:hypothetical protein
MTYSAKELIDARIEARDISERLAVAYWVEVDRRPYHIQDAIKSFEKLAETLGYDIKKREVSNEDHEADAA